MATKVFAAFAYVVFAIDCISSSLNGEPPECHVTRNPAVLSDSQGNPREWEATRHCTVFLSSSWILNESSTVSLKSTSAPSRVKNSNADRLVRFGVYVLTTLVSGNTLRSWMRRTLPGRWIVILCGSVTSADRRTVPSRFSHSTKIIACMIVYNEAISKYVRLIFIVIDIVTPSWHRVFSGIFWK